jgi:hypothetical protein
MRNAAGCMAALLLAVVWGLAGCESKTSDTAAAPQPETKPAAEAPAAPAAPTAPAKPMKPGYPEPAAVVVCAKAPVIDGDLSDGCWKTAELAGVWVDISNGKAAKPQGKVFVCHDDKNLYIAFLNPEPKMKGLAANSADRDGDVWLDDSNEIFIDPSAGKSDYFQFIVNTANVLYDGKNRDGAWNSTAKSAVKKTADGWSVEVAIPLAELGATMPLKGQTWKANFCRNRRVEGESSSTSWSDTGDTFHNPDGFGTLKMQ